MPSFSPRSGKANYIKSRGEYFYYRRVIPAKFRPFFEDKTEWNIKLTATTDAARRAEAGALAHEHNAMMVADLDKVAKLIFSFSGAPGK